MKALRMCTVGSCRSDPGVSCEQVPGGGRSSEGQDSGPISTTRPGCSEIILPSDQQEHCIFQSLTLPVTEHPARCSHVTATRRKVERVFNQSGGLGASQESYV